MPFLVRDGGDGRWKIVGERYVHGMIDGEVMKREDIMKAGKYFLIQ